MEVPLIYNTRNTVVYSVVGRLDVPQIENHIKSDGLGKLVCVTTAGVNHTGIEYTIDRSEGYHDYMLLYVERGEVQIEIGNYKAALQSNNLLMYFIAAKFILWNRHSGFCDVVELPCEIKIQHNYINLFLKIIGIVKGHKAKTSRFEFYRFIFYVQFAFTADGVEDFAVVGTT